MREYEQSRSELGVKKMNVPTRKEASLRISSSIESKAREEKRMKEKLEKMGRLKYTSDGIISRILGINTLDMSKLKDGEDIASYNYGYYQVANILITILCENTIPERITKTIESKKITLDRELYPEELLQEIGSRDREDNNIDINNMPEIIKNNAYYLKGYSRKTK